VGEAADGRDDLYQPHPGIRQRARHLAAGGPDGSGLLQRRVEPAPGAGVAHRV